MRKGKRPGGDRGAGSIAGERRESTAKLADVKEALNGREAYVVCALGITCFESGRHINCPFPEHGGRNDWRWDESKARWICTCGNGDIFDLVQKMQDCGFTEAVEFVAGVIGTKPAEAPKIRGRRKRPADQAKGSRRQSGKVHALLNPGVAARNDDLVRTYLARRLGIDPAEVVMPSTPFAGHVSAPYWTTTDG